MNIQSHSTSTIATTIHALLYCHHLRRTPRRQQVVSSRTETQAIEAFAAWLAGWRAPALLHCCLPHENTTTTTTTHLVIPRRKQFFASEVKRRNSKRLPLSHGRHSARAASTSKHTCVLKMPHMRRKNDKIADSCGITFVGTASLASPHAT